MKTDKISPQLRYYRNNKAKHNTSANERYTRYKDSTNPEERAKYEKEVKTATDWTREWRKNNPEAYKKQARKNHLKNRFGITIEDYDKLMVDQNNLCALCGGVFNQQYKPDTAHLDHDHGTNKIRGIVHQHCNHLLGCAKDDISKLQKAIDYLNKHRLDS